MNKQTRNERDRKLYRESVEFRERVLLASKKYCNRRYREDEAYREKRKEYQLDYYHRTKKLVNSPKYNQEKLPLGYELKTPITLEEAKRIIKELKLSQRVVAEGMGVAQSHLCRILNNYIAFSKKQQKAFVAYMNS